VPYNPFDGTALLNRYFRDCAAFVRNCQELQSEANAGVRLAPPMIFVGDSFLGEEALAVPRK
jgi:hypothetical protein